MLPRQCFVSWLTLVVALSGCQVHVALGPAKPGEVTIAESPEPQPVHRSSATASFQPRPVSHSASDVVPADDELLQTAQLSDDVIQPDGVARAMHEVDAAAAPPLVPRPELLSQDQSQPDPLAPVPPAPRSEDEAADPSADDPSADELSAGEPVTPLPLTPLPADERFPINLGTALELAGANNLQIALATERVREALARLEGAEVLWMPTLNAGLAYNSHVGQIQDTRGGVIDVSRESLFVGAGAKLDTVPLNGGAGGPPRLFVDISPADIYFEPLAARQSAAGAQADQSTVFNDTLLEVTARYLDLLESQSQAAIAEEAVDNAGELVRITDEFFRGGIGLRADAQRAEAELADRRRELLEAEERLRVVSAELARLLRLPPSVVLFAVDAQPVPLAVVDEGLPLDDLIAQGLTSRPELTFFQARVGETLYRMRQEQWRPWLPNVHLGVSSGGFGGGGGDEFGSFSDRTDFDALAVWEVRNLGLGNRAVQRERGSQHRQACLEYEQIRDRVAAEVTRAWQQVQYRRRQIDQAATQVESAAAALALNFLGIRDRQLRPIEAQQAIAALAAARNRYLSAVVDYNRAQFALLRAIGRVPESPAL